MLLQDFNAMTVAEAGNAVRPCVDIDSWVDAVVDGRPYDDLADLLARADAQARTWSRPRSSGPWPTTRGSASGTPARERARGCPAASRRASTPTTPTCSARLADGNAALRGEVRPDLPGPRGRPQRRGDPDAPRGAARQRPGDRDRGDRPASSARSPLLRLEGAVRMSTLSTHVLDAALGVPAAGLVVALIGPDAEELAVRATDGDGRVRFDARARPRWLRPLLRDRSVVLAAGTRHLLSRRLPRRSPCGGDDHYHVALLLSPYSYTTYRGS